MKLVAWDTSSRTGSIVALEWDSGIECRDSLQLWSRVELLTELTLNVDLTHSERLLWGIHQVLESARWKIQDVDIFGVGSGPGSFTGLRIGVTTARLLAHTLKKPIVEFSSLAALARPLTMVLGSGLGLRSSSDGIDSILNKSDVNLVIAAIDACKGELYALWGTSQEIQGYSLGQKLDDLSPGVQYQVSSPDLLVQNILNRLNDLGPNSTWSVVGEGRMRYSDAWKRLPCEREKIPPFLFSNLIQGRSIGVLCFEAIQKGALSEGLQIHPHYMRSSDAEIKLKSGQLTSRDSTRIRH